ncbi:M23 family metallopeptidase [Miltoncostaea oceani]|uniref:M23 family metallopeptidase n=1 Tax=Miltoncostaea oceani TaxID=2843216 RepID=UPI002484A127|nr:peptidoglycan DD-metalloendopeptidase family protein [Miltoncostaea oceani]
MSIDRRSRTIRRRTSNAPVRGAVVAALAGLSALATGAPVLAVEVEVPSPSAVAPPAPPPAPAAAPPATVPPTTAPAAVARASLRIQLGSSGPLVRDLQRELRRRGFRIAVDGSFGPATKGALRGLQRRLGLRPTGVGDARLLRRLGIRVRTAAAAGPRSVRPAGGLYVKVFPVAGDHAYSNDWGAPRGQGGHEGTDILADRHTPLVAADSGVISKISRTESGLGGIYLWLRRPDGIQFYYAHMQSVAEGLDLGSPVAVGQVVGTVGNSGDARFGATHVHFEVRRDWTPFNPYPELVGADPDHSAEAR